MRIAFCGHSHHRTTGSSRFMLEALRSLGPVDEHWVESWREGGAALDPASLLEGGHDAVVVWQMESVAELVAGRRLPNVTFFPMYDSCHARPDSFWRRLAGIKVVCFSSALHAHVLRLGVRSHHVQYYPEVGPDVPSDAGGGLAGFLWQRTQDVSWTTVRALLGPTRLRGLTLHGALDPAGGPLVLPTAEEAALLHLRTTGWVASRQELQAELLRHDLYFAPRLREGIGLSFLEAMALGLLVAAPDRPTMNEYLVSGENGLLYDPAHPSALDFSDHLRMRRRARRSVALGRERWMRSLPALLELVATPTREAAPGGAIDAFDPRVTGRPSLGHGGHSGAPPGGADPGPRREEGTDARPLVSVAILAGSAPSDSAASVRSVLAQEGLHLELLLGAATAAEAQALQAESERVVVRTVSGRARELTPAAAAEAASAPYLLLLGPGEQLRATDTLAGALRDRPAGSDPVVIGHHVLVDPRGGEELRPAADFAAAYAGLRRGDLSWGWLAAAPARAAVLWPTALLRAHPLRADLPTTAHLELLCRLARRGVPFHHALAVLAACPRRPAGIRARHRLLAEWREVARDHTDDPELLRGSLARMRAEARTRELHELPGLDLVFSVLGRAPGVVRELKRRLRRRPVPS